MIKRILPVFLTVSFLICCLVIPAYAAYDPLDFIVNVSSSEDTGSSTFTAEFPNILGGFYFIDNGSNTGFNSASSVIKNVSTSRSYGIWYRPFQGKTGISLEDIPAGTRCAFHTYGLGNFPNSSVSTASITYYSGSTLIQTVGVAKIATYDHGVFQFELNPPDGADSFQFLCDFNLGAPSSSGNIAVGFSSFQLVFNLNDLYYEQIQSGKTNKYLAAIEDKVASNGEKLDDVMNDKVDPEKPAGSDKVDDYQQAESELLDSVQGGSNEFDDVSINAWDRIFTYSQSFMAFGLIFKLFADIPIIQSLLYVSLTLGAFAFMLNLSSSLGSKLSRDLSRRQAAVRYRVSIENRRRSIG